MIVTSYVLREDYWDTFEIQEEDVESLYHHLLELETPLSSREMIEVLVADRIRREKRSIEKRQSAGGDIYRPREEYEPGQTISFPALNWQQGAVVGVREGVNPDIDSFEIIEVEFEDGERKEFAAGLEDHRLNRPMEVDQGDPQLNPELVLQRHGRDLRETLEEELVTNPEFVNIAGRWFPKALLVDVNVGHLNLAEAVLDMEGGGPLPTYRLIEQVELPKDVNAKLVEFSLDLALQEDERFDEVGPAGKVLWFLKRVEPEGVLETPRHLVYRPVEHDRSVLDEEMLALERALNDELSPVERESLSLEPPESLKVGLIYPHWRSGTLPLSPQLSSFFPTAYEAPRIRLEFVDGESEERFPGWVVRKERYVYGLKEWYEEIGLMPGGLVQVRQGQRPGEVLVEADRHRSTREWVRTVLVGADGGVVLAMLKQVVSTDYDERMAIAVPDPDSLDGVWDRVRKERMPFERIVVDIFRELAKLNPQNHVHATELYAGVNLMRRCPPGPVLALLASRPWFDHVGDFYYRLTDFDGAGG